MIRGRISSDNVPEITLSVAGRDWPAIIDTGFNGDLELPEKLRKPLKPHHVGRVTAALGGGQAIEEDVYLVEFLFDGQAVLASATFVLSSTILIGTHMLRDYFLRISFPQKKVLLERERSAKVQN